MLLLAKIFITDCVVLLCKKDIVKILNLKRNEILKLLCVKGIMVMDECYPNLVISSLFLLLPAITILYWFLTKNDKISSLQTFAVVIVCMFPVFLTISSVCLHSKYSYKRDDWNIDDWLFRLDMVLTFLTMVCIVVWSFVFDCNPVYVTLVFLSVIVVWFVLRHMWNHAWLPKDLERCAWIHCLFIHVIPTSLAALFIYNGCK